MTETTIGVSESTPYKPYKSPEGKTYVSTMDQFTSEGGIDFDAPRWTSQDLLRKRADALDNMVDIVNRFEPDTSLDVPKGQSYEYNSSWIVMKTENPRLKADVARVWIQEMVEEGSYARAVDSLLAYDLPDSELPEFQNAEFVGQMFQRAQEEGDTCQARRIADTVVSLEKKNKRESLFRTPSEGSRFNEGWEARERTLYEKEVQDTLKRAGEAEEFDWDVYRDVEMAYQSWNFRDDGYLSDSPHPLAIDTARAYAKMWVGRGSPDRAYQVAVESKLPQADLLEYEKGLPKLQQVKERLKRHFQAVTQKVQ